MIFFGNSVSTFGSCSMSPRSLGQPKGCTMPALTRKITPFLWFDTQAEQAAKFYTAIFRNSRINQISRYGKAGHETHGMDAGSVMTVAFEIEGQSFVALNGGPHFKFNEAVSFQITCETQDEIDYFWSKLSEDGQESQCGWLKDKFGLSWQVVPAILPHLLMGDDKAKSERAMAALMQMKKLDIAALQRAHAGGGQT
jgi:predicted 3-demethylubiquinone-9 3-methyltransferase (glyoxalase superfamily)